MTDSLATGTYEVLRNRLRDASIDLRERLARLNTARRAVFGNIETHLLSTLHVTTEHNCVPRDLMTIGDHVLVGYNVQFGLKSEIVPEDVFSVYKIDAENAVLRPFSQVLDERFCRDFAELVRYYKHTALQRFFHHGPFVYFVFQVGKSHTDIKAFKWTIDGDRLVYVDNRSEHEVRLPTQHAFQWTRATRESHRKGIHPHISIEDIVFVECVGGDLTIKVEDNTDDGSGIYREPVENLDQTLDDAEIHYCVLGNLVLLKVRPYQEKAYRHLVFSTKRQQVQRLDGIELACVSLPDDHGVIFPDGVVLQSGESKVFDHGLPGACYERTISAPNGEDFFYLFREPASGSYLQLRYNLIRREVDVPFLCHGQAFFEDGRMLSFRAEAHAQMHHALQMWQTPFLGPNAKPHVIVDSMLYKIGNRDLVRGMADCREVLQLTERDESYAGLYVDLVKQATDLIDGTYWIAKPETENLGEPLRKIRDAAIAAVDEFEKVVRVRKETESSLKTALARTDETLRSIDRSRFEQIGDFTSRLSELRSQRGHALGLRELRYIDLDAVALLETRIVEAVDRLGRRCVQFLLTPNALDPFRSRVDEVERKVGSISGTADGKRLQAELDTIAGDLDLLVDTISQLKVDDLAQRTAIVDSTADVMGVLNRVRASTSARIRDLLSGEMEAEYAAQSKLLDQAAAGAMAAADSPQKVDDALARMLLQVEELEGRFAEFDELSALLHEKREALCELFEKRRQQLVEQRAKRCEGLAVTAERLLQGIAVKALRIDDEDSLRSYFASDYVVDKVRRTAEQLTELGDSVRAEDVIGRLKSVSDDSLRQLRDRRELFTAGEDLIKLGKHVFQVNRRPLETTTVVRGDELHLHLTGTQFFQPLRDPVLDANRELWGREMPSESPVVYRAEFLAAEYCDLLPTAATWLQADRDHRLELLRMEIQNRHDEGYARGVHDQDAEAILDFLCECRSQLGVLKFSPSVRGRTGFVWRKLVPRGTAERTEQWIAGYFRIADLFPESASDEPYRRKIENTLQKYGAKFYSSQADVQLAAEYLLDELRTTGGKFTASPVALQAVREIRKIEAASNSPSTVNDVCTESVVPRAAWVHALSMADAYLSSTGSSNRSKFFYMVREEIALLLMLQPDEIVEGAAVGVDKVIEPVVGDHPRIEAGRLALNYYEFNERLEQFRLYEVPRLRELRKEKHRLTAAAEQELKTKELKPRVLTSFVRNRLIDEVYLPLIGDNLAKQIGSAGESKRSDRMGLLLLISPPGYGKTTLVEYVANRLGMAMVKINGPALGHDITSLDPGEARNAAAREELRRLGLALEMGDNVMLVIDDIQHCNPEFLQKFIPLCDATRRIEGVWNNQAKTYDLRGRRFAVVMAGNPYTESGNRFQVPDMLANRADIYNLGEIIGASVGAFESSYLENCLTSNPILQSLTRACAEDQRAVIQAAVRGSVEGLDLRNNITADQLSDMLSVLGKLNRVRDVILKVNREYIRSAAQADAYRTEPPFKLQGSYRNMGRIAERIVPVMTDEEVMGVVVSNYIQDAQTLTRDGESNLLKFKELTGMLTSAERDRWEQIKYAYVESVRMQGLDGSEHSVQFLRMFGGMRDGLETIRRAIARASEIVEEGNRRVDERSGEEQIAAAVADLNARLLAIENAAQSGSLVEQKVIVQHAVPRVMTDLVRSQFQLLYDGLRPVLEASAVGRAQLSQMQASINDCLNRYRALQAEIESSPQESSEINLDTRA